jgi:hypothetical protein
VHFFGVPLLSFFLRSVHILGFFASSNICFLKIKNKMKTRLHSKFIFFFVFTSFIFLFFKFDHWFFIAIYFILDHILDFFTILFSMDFIYISYLVSIFFIAIFFVFVFF